MENKDRLQNQDPEHQPTSKQQHGDEAAPTDKSQNKPSDKLVAQDQPLKNNDHDVDPSNPRHSSLGHR